MAAAENPNPMIFPGLDGSPVRLYYVFYPSNTFFVTQDDKVWAMGSNINERCSRPVEVWAMGDNEEEKREKVRSFAHGVFHVLALTENGNVYAWGDTENFQLDFQLAEGEIRKPTLVYDGKTRKDPALEIACGDYHSALRTKNGNVYCWGRNYGGQLGTGDLLDQQTPQQVLGLPEKCTGISCQADATVAVFERGKEEGEEGVVYFWGTGGDGTGNKAERTQELSPTEVGVSRIKKVASGCSHTLALAEDGSLYVWGKNTKGQLGLDNRHYRRQPIHHSASSESHLPQVEMSDITACRYTSAAMTKDSKVLVWGDTIEGEKSEPIEVSGESLQDAFAKKAKDFVTPVPVVGGFPLWTRLSLVRMSEM